MKKNLLLAAVMAVLLVAAFFAGRLSVSRPDSTVKGTQTFYAVIEDISGDVLTVSGLEINDINHRGRFTFSVEKDTFLHRNFTELSVEELAVGNTVFVTYTGSVLEVGPAIIQQVLQVQLLDDR